MNQFESSSCKDLHFADRFVINKGYPSFSNKTNVFLLMKQDNSHSMRIETNLIMRDQDITNFVNTIHDKLGILYWD
jgi:hypothetical protein